MTSKDKNPSRQELDDWIARETAKLQKQIDLRDQEDLAKHWKIVRDVYAKTSKKRSTEN